MEVLPSMSSRLHGGSAGRPSRSVLRSALLSSSLQSAVQAASMLQAAADPRSRSVLPIAPTDSMTCSAGGLHSQGAEGGAEHGGYQLACGHPAAAANRG